MPLGSDEQTEADRAAIEAYAEHEQFWVDESEESWSWHHYYAPSSSAASSSSSDVKAPAPSAPVGPSAKVAQKQWRLLKAGLPAGIFVVACPARVDLLRAMIVGPPGTPYQDAVFLFDLQLPPEFPQQPPNVHYYRTDSGSTPTSTRTARYAYPCWGRGRGAFHASCGTRRSLTCSRS